MKPHCLWCGEYVPKYTKAKRFFCSPECSSKMHQKRPLSIEKNFDIFKRIVDACETPEEFFDRYEKYFQQDG